MGCTAFTGSVFSSSPRAPLAMLYTCHRRVLDYCATLRRLVFYIPECGSNRDAQVVSHGVLRFFDNEIPQHYADEEEHLFPALIESIAGSDALRLRDLTRGSTEQHRALASQWGILRKPLEEIAAGRDTLLPSRSVETFARQWYDHIGLEESELLPMAPRLLTGEELALIGRRMRECRA